MPAIIVDSETYRVITLASKAAGMSHGELIKRNLGITDPGSSTPKGNIQDKVQNTGTKRVYKSFRSGERFDADFHLHNEAMTIRGGRLDGEYFTSPSAAAIAVIKLVNPERENPETNGWKFWRASSNDQFIDQFRRR